MAQAQLGEVYFQLCHVCDGFNNIRVSPSHREIRCAISDNLEINIKRSGTDYFVVLLLFEVISLLDILHVILVDSFCELYARWKHFKLLAYHRVHLTFSRSNSFIRMIQT